jgi:hypothetical protein
MRWILVLVLAAAAAACRQPATQPPSPTSRSAGAVVTAASAAAPTAPSAATPTEPVDRSAVSAALVAQMAVATELGLAPSDVTVDSVHEVTWPDSSLGCPEPDQLYLQVLTPGYLVKVIAQGKTHEVHTDRSEPPRVALCARPRPPISGSSRD